MLAPYEFVLEHAAFGLTSEAWQCALFLIGRLKP